MKNPYDLIRSSPHTHLTDKVLMQDTAKAASKEKACTMVLLEYLLEVDKRRTYADLGFSSLFEYVYRELGYSESQTSERVNAVRLMRGSTQVKEHLAKGELTLTSASQIQRFLRTEKRVAQALPEARKQEVIEACLNRSKREVEQVLFAQASEPTRMALKERVTPVTSTHLELKLTINTETEKKLKRAKEVTQHASLSELLDKALTALIEKQEKKMGKVVNPAKESVRVVPVRKLEDLETTLPVTLEDSASLEPQMALPVAFDDPTFLEAQQNQSTFPVTLEKKITSLATQPKHSGIEQKPDLPQMEKSKAIKTASDSRYIPASYKRILYQRSQGQCEYIHPTTHKRCRSHHNLHIDHVTPLALQGATTPQNLRHLCPVHNQRAAKRAGLETKK